VDFANDTVAVKDAYLQFQGVKIGDTPLYFRAGNLRTPNSFELLTSELFVDMLERAAVINAWQLDRQVGFQVSYWTDHWGLAAEMKTWSVGADWYLNEYVRLMFQ
jgi:phosphate-selective porin